MMKLSLASLLLLLATILLAAWDTARRAAPQPLIPTLTGKTEYYCLGCHAGLPEISSSHPIEIFGCVICHGGERLALETDLAHSTLQGDANPSDLAARVGVYSIQDPDITSITGLRELPAFVPVSDRSAPVKAFSENCLDCHLSAQPLPDPEYARLTGCAACHIPTANRELDEPLHQLTTAIPSTQCNTCHHRGNYNLVEMQFHSRADHPGDRLHDYYQPIAHFLRCDLNCLGKLPLSAFSCLSLQGPTASKPQMSRSRVPVMPVTAPPDDSHPDSIPRR